MPPLPGTTHVARSVCELSHRVWSQHPGAASVEVDTPDVEPGTLRGLTARLPSDVIDLGSPPLPPTDHSLTLWSLGAAKTIDPSSAVTNPKGERTRLASRRVGKPEVGQTIEPNGGDRLIARRRCDLTIVVDVIREALYRPVRISDDRNLTRHRGFEILSGSDEPASIRKPGDALVNGAHPAGAQGPDHPVARDDVFGVERATCPQRKPFLARDTTGQSRRR